MNESAKTGLVVVLAVVATALAVRSAPTPKMLEGFSDQGQAFYPEFKDPLKATTLEVINYDESSGTATPFKVTVQDGLWSIPSHYHYPADGKDRLANTASALMDLKKDVIQSNRTQDHEALGVINPLDDTSLALKGRGQRAILRDESGSVLADFIIGKRHEGKPGFRYVRVPEKKRTYAVKVDVDISTRFTDWIETNLLELSASDIISLTVNDYSVDESTGQVEVKGNTKLAKFEDTWAFDGMPEDKELQQQVVETMASALSRIRITGVRPKPDALTEDLRTSEGIRIGLETRLSLSSKGFFITEDGLLVSNEGEVGVGTKDGVRYTLRFGEILFGEGLGVSAGTENDEPEKDATEQGGPENRYLFVTADFDEALLGDKPAEPQGYVPLSQLTDNDGESDNEEDSTDPEDNAALDEAIAYESALSQWQANVTRGRELAQSLNDRFAAWYYVISAADFGSIRVSQDDLLANKALDDQEDDQG